MVKVFISHQRADSQLAIAISHRLRHQHAIDTYLDVIDDSLGLTAGDLGDHVRARLGQCTQLLAVVSQATRTSWWVPWEIGVATEKHYPLATYAGGPEAVPEYLRRWPYLRSDADLDRYAAASRVAEAEYRTRSSYLRQGTARERSTKDFFRSLRSSLGQG